MIVQGARWARTKLAIGQRWRRRSDGVVVTITNLHRKDGSVELAYEAALQETRWPKRFTLNFVELRRDFEQLVTHEDRR